MAQVYFISHRKRKKKPNFFFEQNLDESKDDETNDSSNHDENPSNDDEYPSKTDNENTCSHSDQYEKLSSKEKHLRRPMNSFMLFSQEQRAKIHLANPNRDNRNVSKILGEKWYSLSAHEQEQYRIKAKQLRHEHFKQNSHPKDSINSSNKSHHSIDQSVQSKDEQEQCRRSARLQSQSNQSPCDRLRDFAQICTNMPKLTEESTQGFSPINKPSNENSSMSTELITPVPIHANIQPIESNETDSLSNSPRCRTIVSMLINQYKTNFNLEQQLKDLQSTSKATTSQSPIPVLNSSSIDHAETFPFNLKRTSFDENQPKQFLHQNNLLCKQFEEFFNRTVFSFRSLVCSSSSNSTGYSSGSSSIDSSSTILSAYSSRSNSSLSERSKTSPTPLKQISSIQYLPMRNPLTITTDDEITQLTSFNSTDVTPRPSPSPTTSQQCLNKSIYKRKKTVNNQVFIPRDFSGEE